MFFNSKLYKMRIEKDGFGQLEIPDNSLYGLQSLRGYKNFQISGTQIHPVLIQSYILLKKAAAKANKDVGALDEMRANAIISTVESLLETDYLQHFIIDTYQAGAGTSQNMNTNEVIANAANKLLGGELGKYDPVHPNDHVNMSQSTNDTYPTVMQLSSLKLSKLLIIELEAIANELGKKAVEFDSIIKSGRTHLQDAVPIRLGQEFKANQEIILLLIGLVKNAQDYLRVLGIGGSAIGTGINVPKGFQKHIIISLQQIFKDDKLTLANNMCASMQSQLPIIIYSNSLRVCALELTKIFNDLRLASSGPLNGLGEIMLPETQAGSSIMPGKINPSILEMGNQVCFKVLGNDSSMGFAIQAGQLELNVMMPLMAHLALESTHLLINAIRTVRELCISGITANVENCKKQAERTSQIITAISPLIGYNKATEITKESLSSHKTILEIVKDKNILTDDQVEIILDPYKMTTPLQ